LSVYHCSAAWNEDIKGSIFCITSRIAVFAELSIFTLALSFRILDIAPVGVSYDRRRRICSGSPWSFIAVLMANNRSEILIGWLVFPLLKRIRLSTISRPFWGAKSLFWGFFRWISVQLSSLFNYWVIKLLILAISAYIAFIVFYKAFSVTLEEGGRVP
jgi:hypothetical protein